MVVSSKSSKRLIRIWQMTKTTKGTMNASRAASQMGMSFLRRG